MANIPKTVLGTSDPIDICCGFYLFANDKPAPRLAYETGWIQILDVNPQVLAWILHFKTRFNLTVGACGPSYGVRFQVDQGTTGGNQVHLQVSNDAIAAGAILGVYLNFSFDLGVQQWKVRWVEDGWNSHFQDYWESVFESHPQIQLDVIEIVFGIIQKVLEKLGQNRTVLQKIATRLNDRPVQSLGLWDFQQKQLAASGGTIEASPGFSIPIDIVQLTSTLPPPVNALYLLDKALQGLYGGLQMGPMLTISVPISVKLSQIMVDNATYGNLRWSGNQVTGTGPQESPQVPRRLGVRLEERPSFRVEFQLFLNFSILKLFSLSPTYNVADLTKLLGINISGGPFGATVSGPTGGQPNPCPHTLIELAGGRGGFAFDAAEEAFVLAPVEVVFEPVGESA
jgi:hypothetical protein